MILLNTKKRGPTQEEAEPDEEEKWLMKRLFGQIYTDTTVESEAKVSQEDDMITEAEVFRVDKRKTETLRASRNKGRTEKNEKIKLAHQAAWIDKHDEAVRISLIESKRLKKLRTFEEDTTLSGTEFQERLRKQFLKLHHAPRWAQTDTLEHQEDPTDELAEKGGD
jgi:U3 small nucleolar RNA-associated protein 18